MGLLQEKKMHLSVIYLHPEVAELKSAKQYWYKKSSTVRISHKICFLSSTKPS